MTDLDYKRIVAEATARARERHPEFWAMNDRCEWWIALAQRWFNSPIRFALGGFIVVPVACYVTSRLLRRVTELAREAQSS